ncbi:MAG: transglycosylase SLT domain-containing protein [Candidatus Limiplasma sp.]|nr:transglycosylase SLT domain-containing protein [Candidatus Limiplasma sp.]
MIRWQLKYRSDDDDYAPIDYSFVRSQAEGRRRREAEAIHKGPADAVVRHRVDPEERTVDAYGTHARRSPLAQPAPEPVRRGLPSMADGQPPAQRIAYPQGREPGWTGRENALREEAFEEDLQEEAVSQEEAYQEPPYREPPQEGPIFDDPAPPEIPEWLRIAKQNNMPLDDRLARRPTVTAAPKQEEPQRDLLGRPLRPPRAGEPGLPPPQGGVDYQEAGYPPELLQQQYLQEQAARAQEVGSHRHGAQRALRFQQQPGQPQPPPPAQLPSSYPPRREERQESRRRALTPQEQEAFTGRGSPQSAEVWQDYGPQGYPQGGGYAQDYAPRRYAGEAAPPGNPYGAAQSYAPPAAANPAPNAPPAYDPYRQQGYGYPEAPPQAYPEPGAYARRTRAPRPQEERDEAYAQEEARKLSIPWLGIGTAALAFLAVALWLMQMSFATQKEAVLRHRDETAAAIAESHPYRYRELIETQAQINNLHPAFIAAIVLNESSFNPQAESSVGARGLMQMMPDTAQWVHGKIAEGEEYSFDRMYDPDTNVRYACWYMKFLSERFRGDPVLVAAAFHAGQGTVQNWLNDSRYSADSQTIDLQDMMDGPTKNYASRVLSAYAVYKRLYYEDQGIL